MTYRRNSMISRLQRAIPPASAPSFFEKLVAIANLASTTVLGIVGIALTVVSFNLNRDFNEWQKHNSDTQDHHQKIREGIIDTQSTKDRCIRIADIALRMAMNEKEMSALSIFSKALTVDPECMSSKFNIMKFTAALVVKYANRFDSKIVARSATIVAATTGGQSVLRQSSTTDRFSLGESQLRGFDIRGIGPKVIRRRSDEIIADTLGGGATYLGHSEIELTENSTSDATKLHPCSFIDGGVEFKRPDCGSDRPRLGAGSGVDWNSPFGPFKIEIANALVKEAGDDTKTVQFNVGTQF